MEEGPADGSEAPILPGPSVDEAGDLPIVLEESEFSADLESQPPRSGPVDAGPIIAALDVEEPGSLDAVEEIVGSGREAAATMRSLLDSPDVVERWAGVYYFSRLAQVDDIPVLAPLLTDTEFSNRVGIAATLLRLNDERGLPILMAALESDETQVLSEPPLRVAAYAQDVLAVLRPDLVDGPVEPILDESAERLSLSLGGVGGLAQPLAPPEGLYGRLEGCSGVIELKLQFRGPGATLQLANKWVRATHRRWNGKLSTGCCDLKLRWKIKLHGSLNPDYVDIWVHKLPPGGYHRNFVQRGSGTLYSNTGVRSEFSNLTLDWTAAHEIGHILGVDDEYRDVLDPATGESSSQPIGNAATEFRGPGNTPSLMAQVWTDDEGNEPTAKVRHIDTILEGWDIECPERCLSEWSARGPTPTPRTRLLEPPTPTPTPTATPAPAQAPTPTAAPTLVPRPIPTPPATATPTPTPAPTATVFPVRNEIVSARFSNGSGGCTQFRSDELLPSAFASDFEIAIGQTGDVAIGIHGANPSNGQLEPIPDGFKLVTTFGNPFASYSLTADSSLRQWRGAYQLTTIDGCTMSYSVEFSVPQ